MSTILVNKIKSYSGDTVAISGSNITVSGNTTLGDSIGTDTITVNGHITASGNISVTDLHAHTIQPTLSTLGISGSLTTSGSILPYWPANQGNPGTTSIKHELGSESRIWNILHVGKVSALRDVIVGGIPTSAAAAPDYGLYTLSGSQIFSSSAFPGGSNPFLLDGAFSSSLFVFKKDA
jgi:hypothetical protein